MRDPDDRSPERLALLVVALDRDRAPVWLDALGEPARSRALTAAARFARLSADDRRALVRRELGARPDGEERLRRTMAEASPELRAALYCTLPRHTRSLFPELADTARADQPPPRPHLRAFALRRAREALR